MEFRDMLKFIQEEHGLDSNCAFYIFNWNNMLKHHMINNQENTTVLNLDYTPSLALAQSLIL